MAFIVLADQNIKMNKLNLFFEDFSKIVFSNIDIENSEKMIFENLNNMKCYNQCSESFSS